MNGLSRHGISDTGSANYLCMFCHLRLGVRKGVRPVVSLLDYRERFFFGGTSPKWRPELFCKEGGLKKTENSRLTVLQELGSC